MDIVRKQHVWSLLLAMCAVRSCLGEECVPVAGAPSCVCQTSTGIIDLRPLAKTDGTPMYKDIEGANGFHYSYNPCYSYTIGTCVDAYICQWNDDSQSGYSIADNATEAMTISTSPPMIKYTTTNPVVSGGTMVNLICDQGVEAEHHELIKIDSPALSFAFNLTSCQVCPGGCIRHGGGGGGIIGIIGITLILLVLLGLLVYCIGGVIFLKVRKSSDDVIPNQSFWMGLPILIKDGCLFIISPCQRRKDGYTNI